MKKLYLILGMVAIIGFCFQPVMAQEEVTDGAFGPGIQVKWIGSFEFDSAWAYPYLRLFENREIYNRWIDLPQPWWIPENPDLSAVFHLPSGASLENIRLYAFDGMGIPDVNVECEIVAENWAGKNSVQIVKVETDTDDLGLGYQTVDGAPPANRRLIRNQGNFYHARVTLDNGDRSIFLRLWGVKLFYRLQVNPNLPTNFTDIGHLNERFQNGINALDSAGITNGCTPTEFCPDRNITRGEMAVFLAEALGLNWE